MRTVKYTQPGQPMVEIVAKNGDVTLLIQPDGPGEPYRFTIRKGDLAQFVSDLNYVSLDSILPF